MLDFGFRSGLDLAAKSRKQKPAAVEIPSTTHCCLCAHTAARTCIYLRTFSAHKIPDENMYTYVTAPTTAAVATAAPPTQAATSDAPTTETSTSADITTTIVTRYVTTEISFSFWRARAWGNGRGDA